MVRESKKCEKEVKANKKKTKGVSYFFVCVFFAVLCFLCVCLSKKKERQNKINYEKAQHFFPQSKKMNENRKTQPKICKKTKKKAMEKGNMEGARIYAENAIRLHNQSLNYLKLSSRIDAVAARVNTAIQMGNLTKNMQNIVKSMDSVMASMDVEKISAVMDKFEQQFEDMDLNSKFMENAIDSTTAQTMPENDVENLMAQV